MPKTKKQPKPRTRGNAGTVDAVIGNKRSRAFLASIESDGRDHMGRVVAPNGIKWVIT